MNAQELELDYFKFYDAENQPAGDYVAVQGQFDDEPERIRLTYLDFFGNLASKNGEPIYDKNAHLNWYDIIDPVPEPLRAVTFENQFGQQRILIGRSYALLVPAQKIGFSDSFPDKLDHYKVYQVLEGEPVDKTVEITDQMGPRETKISDPIFFAVPVRKWFEFETYGIRNEKAHLAIYRIYPEPADFGVANRDQFRRLQFQVYRSVLLGVPSAKLEWNEVRS